MSARFTSFCIMKLIDRPTAIVLITIYLYQTVVQGLTGDVKFDNQGYRTNFAVDVIELTSSGITKVGTWNSTEGLTITRKYDEKKSENNKTFIVMLALVIILLNLFGIIGMLQ